MKGQAGDLTPLSAAQETQLAGALDETPDTAAPIGLLISRRARAFAQGDPGRFTAATVQDRNHPAVCWGFGSNVSALADMLQRVPDWESVSVRPAIAAALGQMLHTRTGHPYRPYDDLCFALTHPVNHPGEPLVRALTIADLPLLAAAPYALRGSNPAALLRERPTAGAIVGDRLVSLARAYAVTPRYTDIIVYTIPARRARGWATAATALVVAAVQANGRIPVLRTGAENIAARRIAARLGFREVGRRTHLRPG